MFDTGTNEWKTYPAWPPKAAQARPFYLQPAGVLYGVDKGQLAPYQTLADHVTKAAVAPALPDSDGHLPASSAFTEYLSDPAHPVPYAPGILSSRSNEYMIADQRFAAERPDVLTFQTPPLPQDLTVAGPLGVDLWVSTSGTDADFVVKLIDVLPDDAVDPAPGAQNTTLPGTQRLVRADVFRGRFRRSFERPAAFEPNVPTEVKYEVERRAAHLPQGPPPAGAGAEQLVSTRGPQTRSSSSIFLRLRTKIFKRPPSGCTTRRATPPC